MRSPARRRDGVTDGPGQVDQAVVLRRRAATTMPMAIDMSAIVERFDESSPVSGSPWVVVGVVDDVAPPPVFDEATTVVLVVVGATDVVVVVVVVVAGAVGVPVMAFDAAESPTAFTALMVIE